MGIIFMNIVLKNMVGFGFEVKVRNLNWIVCYVVMCLFLVFDIFIGLGVCCYI